jgi:hypothetical protein
VYVCTVRGSTTDAPSEIDPGDVVIRHWGVVTPLRPDDAPPPP